MRQMSSLTGRARAQTWCMRARTDQTSPRTQPPAPSRWRAAQDEARKADALLARRGALAAKRADLERRVRELGSLPADAFERYRGTPLPDLRALLVKAQAQLKKYQCAAGAAAEAPTCVLCASAADAHARLPCTGTPPGRARAPACAPASR